ncbi:hypothetical protein [Virgibacillus salinus]|uniref:Uncharacterized protein n=1 Tax=Virgibacillus salinus TaxID=553311 RepID=A0A1H1B8W6_9BACI|nr:hypothetical protein [Virgibacillus salinus]SDQ48428.1 hypothetical protein SAMN05216231_1657 [Virgibacillus salinus]
MRSLVVLLLLALFFLVGIVVGLDRGESATDPIQSTENTVRTEEVEEKQVVVVEQTTSENIMTAEAPVQFTQKIAKFLEASVQGFYEIIVEVIYQIVQVFF